MFSVLYSNQQHLHEMNLILGKNRLTKWFLLDLESLKGVNGTEEQRRSKGLHEGNRPKRNANHAL